MRERAEYCEEHCVHEERVAHVKLDMPDEESLYDLAELLNMSQSAISHQLRVLKQARLVRSRREGKTVFYFLADEHVRTIIGQGMEHIEE